MFQSTHPGRGATPLNSAAYVDIRVSIHAPRAGCDRREQFQLQWRNEVSIHAPRAGCDLMLIELCSVSSSFNPRTPGGVRR